MELAHEFHEPNVDRLASSLTSKQLTEWVSYFRMQNRQKKTDPESLLRDHMATKASGNVREMRNKHGVRTQHNQHRR